MYFFAHLNAFRIDVPHNACSHAVDACEATVTAATQEHGSQGALGVLEEM